MDNQTSDYIIAVDDDPRTIKIVEAYLGSSAQYKLKTFTSPIDALNFYKTNPDCRLIISDHCMPEMNGDDLREHIGYGVPWVTFSDKDYEELIHYVEKDNFVHKTNDGFKILAAKVKETLENHLQTV